MSALFLLSSKLTWRQHLNSKPFRAGKVPDVVRDNSIGAAGDGKLEGEGCCAPRPEGRNTYIRVQDNRVHGLN